MCISQIIVFAEIKYEHIQYKHDAPRMQKPTCTHTNTVFVIHVQYSVHCIEGSRTKLFENMFSLILRICANVCRCVWEGTLDMINAVYHCLLIDPHILCSPPINNETPQAPNLKRNQFPWNIKRDTSPNTDRQIHKDAVMQAEACVGQHAETWRFVCSFCSACHLKHP